MKTRRAVVDVDGVCANLIGEWLRWYNLDYGESLSVKKVTSWEIHNFVLPKCGTKIYEYLKIPELYDGVVPITGAADGINEIRNMDFEIVFVTTALKQWGFSPREELYVETPSKHLIRADLMIDDYHVNLRNFEKEKILFLQHHNLEFRNDFISANGWNEVIDVVKKKFKQEGEI
jgi:5'-nucleotidase